MAESHKQPITLALEISQANGSVAMSNNNGEVSSRKVASGRRDKDDTMPAIDELAKELSINPSTIELVVVSTGPGGFTGLRTAVSIAKMLSITTRANIIPIESAVVTVCSAGFDTGSYFVVSGVKQDTFWLSNVTCKDCEFECEAGLTSTAGFVEKVHNTSGVFADSFAPDSILQICRNCNTQIHTPQPEAATLLGLGHRRYSQSNFIQPANLLPLYPREPEAVRIWNEKNNPA